MSPIIFQRAGDRKKPKLEEKKTLYEYRYLFILGFFIIILLGVAFSQINSKLMPLFVMLGMFTCILPYFVVEYMEFAKYKKMEDYFPFFLRDFAEAIRSGMTFPAALRMTAKVDYGALSAEIRRAAAQLSWGVPFVKVLYKMGQRIRGSRILRQCIAIIIETFNSGGDVATTMDSLADSMTTLREMEMERRAALSQQIIVIYLVFFIFLGLLIGMDKYLLQRFMTTFQSASITATEVGGIGGLSIKMENYCNYHIALPICIFGKMFGFNGTDLYFKSMFLIMAIIQSVCQGVLIGIMVENNAKAGFKHIAIMLSISLVALSLFLGG